MTAAVPEPVWPEPADDPDDEPSHDPIPKRDGDA